MRCQLSGGHELGEPTEADRCGLTAEFREDIEAVEGRASRDEELSCVEGDLGGGRDAERDADASPLQGSQRGPECSSAHRLDDEIVLGLARDLVAHHHVVGAQLAHRRRLVGPSHVRGHVGAGEPGQLHREVSDPARRAGDEHPPPEQQTALAERQQRCEPRHREGGSLRERHLVGQLGERVLGDGHPLSPRALREKADDPRACARA